MALAYLFDTNAVSDLIRNPAGIIADRIDVVGDDTVCTSTIVLSEIRFGIAKAGSHRLLRQLETVLTELPVLPFEPPADRVYGEIRAYLERVGMPIGPNDLFIAAHALALDLTLVTANEREFRRVPGLKVENWLAVLE